MESRTMSTYPQSSLANCYCLSSRPKMTTNKNYIKLSGDGAHKLTHDDWSFITLGVLSKHYSLPSVHIHPASICYQQHRTEVCL